MDINNMVDIVIYGGILLASFSFVYMVVITFPTEGKRISKSVSENTFKLSLKKMSTLWAGKVSVFKLEDLAVLWRESEEAKAKQSFEFSNARIIDFYETWIRTKTFIRGNASETIMVLLKILDEKGHSPSVVNDGAENSDKMFDGNSYAILKKVNVLDHTLNVVESAMKKAEKGPAVTKTIIAALAHDLGKLPEYRNAGKLYSMGDHPKLSVEILNSISVFNRLPYASDIVEAVLNHHIVGQGKSPLTKSLKNADHEARRLELSNEIARHLNKGSENANRVEPINKPDDNGSVPKIEKNTSILPVETIGRPAVEIIEGFPGLDMLTLLNRISNQINVTDDGGTKFQAFSMPAGIVYVWPSAIQEMVATLMAENGTIIGEDNWNDEAKVDLLVKVVNQLKNSGLIPEGMVGDGYYSARFDAFMEEGKKFRKARWVPILVDAFPVSLAELEGRKTGILLEIKEIQKIYEKY